MPAKIIKKRAAQRIRKSTDQRSKQQKTGREGMQPTKNTDAIIADSLSTVRLKPRGGAEVFLMDEENTSVEKIYNDIKASYVRIVEILKVEGIYFKALEQMTIRVKLDWVIMKFRSLLPHGLDFEIKQKDYKDWCFVVFKELDQKQDYDVIFVENVLGYLNKNNKSLHNLFVEFLKILANKANINGWWDSYADQWMEQEIMDNEDNEDVDTDYYNLLKKQLDLYRKKAPSKYEKKIKRSKYMNPLVLAGKLKRIKEEKKLVDILIEGCQLLNEPYDVTDFGYAGDERMNDAGLHWEDQAAIMWTASDAFFDMHEEFLNTEAQEGLFPPTIHKVVDKNMQESDFNWLRNGEDWPVKLSNLFYDLNEILRSYERNS